MALTICAVLGMQAGPVWAATSAIMERPSLTLTPGPTSPSSMDAPTTATPVPAPQGRPATAAAATRNAYAAREAAKPQLQRFKGGSASIYIGGSTIVIILLIVLLIVLL